MEAIKTLKIGDPEARQRIEDFLRKRKEQQLKELEIKKMLKQPMPESEYAPKRRGRKPGWKKAKNNLDIHVECGEPKLLGDDSIHKIFQVFELAVRGLLNNGK